MTTGTEQAAVDSDLPRCIAFLRWFDERCAERRVPFRYGVAYFCDSLPLVWSLNAIALDDGVTASAEELAGEAEQLQGDAGLLHRKGVTGDGAGGSRLGAGLRRPRWAAA